MNTLSSIPRTATELADWVRDTRQRSLSLLADLSDAQLIGPRLSIVNPLLWEIGHVAWFQERWVLGHVLGESLEREDGDELWDSMEVDHDSRWDLRLPARQATLAYVNRVAERVLERIARIEDCEPETAERLAYFVLYTVFHEDMHGEAFTYTRQTLGYPPPPPLLIAPEAPSTQGSRVTGDARIPGGRFQLGASRDAPFAFDNEKWAHEVPLAPFAIARCAVTQAEFQGFVDDGGYQERELWDADGWRWRVAEQAEHPVYWRRGVSGWERRVFDHWRPLESDLPVVHVSWHEAQAYCRWAGRRLPSEAQWEAAACAGPSGLEGPRRHRPWGELSAPPEYSPANLDARVIGTLPVHALAEGDSASGCRQMLGNVWEWTASDFEPYPDFVADPYKEYSEPWFGSRKVLRGGCWATRSRLVHNTWRNFYEPFRRDVFAGFRTCAP